MTEVLFSSENQQYAVVDRRADAMNKANITEEFTQWLAWAEQKVSWYDPMVNGPDPLLNDHHKTHLFKDFLKEWQ